MEIQPTSLELILDWLRKQAIQHKSSFVFEARIVIDPQETKFLNLEPATPLETIPF